jgi:Glycosyl hydrolase catalytic core
MKLLLATALLTLAVCVAALGCGSDSESTTVQNADVPGTFFGVVPQGALTADDLNRMGAGKVGTLRIVLPWHDLDTTAKPGDTDLATIDPVVLDAARNGIQVLPTIFSTPDWVANGLDGQNCLPSCATFAPHSDAALAAWKGFVGDMVARYGPGGEFWTTHPEVTPIPVRTWQIWNEQNSPTFFQPAPDPAAYAKLLSSAAETIRKRDPGAQIVLGGMFQTNGSNGAIGADDFLRQLYAIDDARDDFDGVATHPYAHDVAKIEAQVRLLHDEITRADDDASLWVTEVGASSADGANSLELGEEGQADLLRDAFNFFLSKRAEWKIQSVIWYSWRDTSADPPVCDWCANSGLFPEASLDPKPAWAAFTSFTGGT